MSMFQTIGLIAIGAGAVYGYSLFNGGSKPNTAYATADNAALTYMSNLTRDIEQFKKSYCPSKINQSLDSCVISAIEGYVGQR